MKKNIIFGAVVLIAAIVLPPLLWIASPVSIIIPDDKIIIMGPGVSPLKKAIVRVSARKTLGFLKSQCPDLPYPQVIISIGPYSSHANGFYIPPSLPRRPLALELGEIVINTKTCNNVFEFMDITCHEIFHLYQNYLAGDCYIKAPDWLQEGSASVLADQVIFPVSYLFSYGNENRQLLLLSRPNEEDIELTKEFYRSSRYIVKFLLQYGGLPAVLKYYRLLGTGMKHKRAFKVAFGIEEEEFFRRLQNDTEVFPKTHINK